eukprot:UN32533
MLDKYMPKTEAELLKKRGYVGLDKKVLINTGIMFLTAKLAYNLRSSRIPDSSQFKLSTEFLCALTNKISENQYLTEINKRNNYQLDEEEEEVPKKLYNFLKNENVFVTVPDGKEVEYYNFESTADYMYVYLEKHYLSKIMVLQIVWQRLEKATNICIKRIVY